MIPTLDKWLPSPNTSVEIDEGYFTEFTCIYNASTNPNITIAIWKFNGRILDDNSSHYEMITKYGTDPANTYHILSVLNLLSIATENAGNYTCQCIYNTSTLYSKEQFYSEAKSFHLKIKPVGQH